MDEPERVPIKDLKVEEGADELADSPDMEPYVELAIAAMKGSNMAAALGAIAELPLEQRYVWRVVSTLKWAFTTSTIWGSLPIAILCRRKIWLRFWISYVFGRFSFACS